MADERPNAEQMLARIRTDETDRKDGRGRLKIFFGYAAGVGKTYTMLEEARARAVEGVDVVIGYAEPHGRPETEALLLGLEILPYKTVQYHNVTLRDFDLDAALTRKPALIVVDELAHTNAQGLRHAKRYQDVLTLLQEGIDVYTTVNVQHLESLNDVVAQITGVRVRESIPDDIFDRSSEVELIDIPPDELLERLHAGKVYLPEQATRAMDRFFRKANLIALREIALRKTADRVNAQVQTARTGQTTERIWPTRERLLVCVSPSPNSAKVIRSGRQMAAALRAEWIAVGVLNPAVTARPGLDENYSDYLKRHLHVAERLGAETALLSATNVAEEILDYARRRNITKIVIGKPEEIRRRWWLPWRRTVADQLLARSGEIDIYVIRGFGDIRYTSRPKQRKRLWPYLESLGVMTLATLAAWLLSLIEFSNANIVMTLLLGVVVVAARYRLGPAILASVTGALAFNYFFAPPIYTFAIRNTENIVAFFAMLVVALLISTLTTRVRRQAEIARMSQQRTESLYRLSRKIGAATNQQEMVAAAREHLRDTFGGEAVFFLPDDSGKVDPRYGHTPNFAFSANERAAAQWVFDHGQNAGAGTETLPNAAAFYLPMEALGERAGVLAIRSSKDKYAFTPDQRHLLETLATQLALGLQREQHAAQARRMLVEAEAERTRSALLSSVSHDLRTPLAAISGASSGLIESGGTLDAATRNELAQTIYDEANRLTRLVENLLRITRLESGTARVDKEWQPLEEVIGSALRRARPYLKNAEVNLKLPPDLQMVPLDGVLIEQVLINLLENASKYAGPDPKITIRARTTPNEATIQVLDKGPGIAAGRESRIFEKFARADSPESTAHGAGLGLAICKAIVEAHGGRIRAENRPKGGARFTFTLPTRGSLPREPRQREGAVE